MEVVLYCNVQCDSMVKMLTIFGVTTVCCVLFDLITLFLNEQLNVLYDRDIRISSLYTAGEFR